MAEEDDKICNRCWWFSVLKDDKIDELQEQIMDLTTENKALKTAILDLDDEIQMISLLCRTCIYENNLGSEYPCVHCIKHAGSPDWKFNTEKFAGN